MLNGVESLLDYIKPSKLMCYVLIGYWSSPDEDLDRVMTLWEDYKIDAFVMPFDKFDDYQLNFARWCNNKMLFKTRSWEDYWDGNRGSMKQYNNYLEKQRRKQGNVNQWRVFHEK